jgi:hypothetical protein
MDNTLASWDYLKDLRDSRCCGLIIQNANFLLANKPHGIWGDRLGIIRLKGCWSMSRGFFQSVAIVICAIGVIYTLIILQRDGTLQTMWDALTSGAFGGYPL